VAGEQWKSHCLWQVRLRQGYLSRPGDGLSVRVRLSDGTIDGMASAEAWLTLKAPPPPAAGALSPSDQATIAREGLALARQEFEYAIPPADAEALLALTDQQLVKCRYGLDLPGGDWVLDVFEGANAPLVVAEVELQDAAARPPVPSWCVRELTGLRQLSNASLAGHPLRSWSLEERQALLAGAEGLPGTQG
jgi:CYTH domain-containing protein